MDGGDAPLPGHDEVVRDLRLLREKGLLRLRRLDLPALGAAARAAGRTGADPDPRAVEQLLRDAVDALGDEEPGTAARYLFGLVQGTAGRRPTDLREAAAGVYGRSVETFRKEPERLLVDRVATEVLRLCPDGAGAPAPVPPRVEVAARVRADLEAALERVRAMGDADPADVYRAGRHGPFALPAGATSALVTVDLGAVEELRDVDLLVSSENTYLEPARPFAGSLSAHLRNAAALRDRAGVVVRDVVADELAQWVRANARVGGQVDPGVVAPTSAGALAGNGVRRILHAAVCVPRLGRNGYDVPANGVHRAVRGCFELARAERERAAAEGAGDVGSFTIPLFGAGDGGLDAAASFSRLWPAVHAELAADPTWHVHLTTWTVAETVVVLDGLLRAVGEEP